MAGSIGGIACTFVKPESGEPEALKVRVRSWRRPGMVGEGNQKIGAGPGDFAYVAVLYDTPGNVFNWSLAIANLVGSIVVIIDDFGTQYNSMLIKGATRVTREPAWNGSAQNQRGSMTVYGSTVV